MFGKECKSKWYEGKILFISIRVLIIQTMGRHQYTYYYSLVVASPMCEKKSKDFDEQRSMALVKMEWVNALVSTWIDEAKSFVI